MEARSFRVEEQRRDHLDLGVTAADRTERAQPLAVALRSALQETQSYPMSEHRRVSHRGEIALVVLETRYRPKRKEVGAAIEPRGSIDRLDADERRPIGIGQTRSFGQYAADEILLLGHHAAEPKIGGGRRAVQLVARDMTLFDAHHTERLGSVRRDIERFTRAHDRPDHRISVAGRHGKLVGQLAGEGNTEHPDRKVPPGELRAGEIGKGPVGQVERIAEEPFEELARLRSRNRVLGPLLGHGDDLNVQLGP